MDTFTNTAIDPQALRPDASVTWSTDLGAWVTDAPGGRLVYIIDRATWMPLPAPIDAAGAPGPTIAPPTATSNSSKVVAMVAVVVALLVMLGAAGTMAVASTTSDPVPVGPPTTMPKGTTPPTTAAPTTVPPTTEAPTTEAPTTEAPTTEPPTTSPGTARPTPRHPRIEASDSIVIGIESTKDTFGPGTGSVTVARRDGSGSFTFDHGSNLHLSGAGAGTYVITYKVPAGFEVVGNSDGKASATMTVELDGSQVAVVWFSVMPASVCHPTSHLSGAAVHSMGDNGTC